MCVDIKKLTCDGIQIANITNFLELLQNNELRKCGRENQKAETLIRSQTNRFQGIIIRGLVF